MKVLYAEDLWSCALSRLQKFILYERDCTIPERNEVNQMED